MKDDRLRSNIEEVLNQRALVNEADIIKRRIFRRYIFGGNKGAGKKGVEGHWYLVRPIHNDINFFIHKDEVATGDVGKYISLRRLIYLLWIGPIPEGRHITNNCGIYNCVAPNHLKLRSKEAIPL